MFTLYVISKKNLHDIFRNFKTKDAAIDAAKRSESLGYTVNVFGPGGKLIYGQHLSK